ncbi:MAG: dTDP-glucose 4,6-dehydratase [Chloroflexi bacterium RBG_16_57_11]|nr:MAG: dTDP-glucose 4,6-dehydratase [Chloroflexi bacterium RBG_16_57_11]
MQNVIVTGGAGFIGSNFVRYLLGADHQVRIINLDALTYAGSLENLKNLPASERHIFVQGDICDRALVDDLLARYQIDTIVHFAAETHVDRSILGPEQFIRTNVMGTFTLLEAARRYWLDEKANPVAPQEVRFHHISTDEVFGTLQPDDPPFSEITPYAPRSPYAASKAASDHLVRAYGHTYGLPFTITNCTNNYGPYQFPEKLIPLMILNALQGRLLPVYGDGQQIRDWLYVEDHCEAILTVLRHGQVGESYNVGGGNQPTNLTVIHEICDILDELQPNSPYSPHDQLIQYVKDRPGHDRRYAMDITSIQRELDWHPRQSLSSGLARTVQWYLENPSWIDAIHQQQDYQGWLAKNYGDRETTSNQS